MRLATYNVNGVNGRLPVLLHWLEIERPDIVCLQELKSPDRGFPAAALQKLGYSSAWHGQSQWNGVAILSRSQIVVRRRGLPGDDGDTQSRYIEAETGGIIVACLYLPNGNPAPGPKFDYKLAWFDRLLRHARSLQKLASPVALAGDFNVIPTDLDVYAPERWRDDALFRSEVRTAYAKLLKQGWTDAIRQLHPEDRIYTFWKYWRQSFERDAGLRIDHLLLNPALTPRLKTAGVSRVIRALEKTSDHAPAWIELKRRVGRKKPA